MSKTAKQVLDLAFSRARIKSAGIEMTDTELSNGVDTLNLMIASLYGEGFELYTDGYVELSNVSPFSDVVPCDNQFLEFIVVQLAGRFITEYQSTDVPPYLTEQIQGERRKVVRALNRKAVGTTGTYRNLIYAAIEISGVKAGTEPVSTEEVKNGIPMLNDIMTSLESKSFRLGYQIATREDLDKEHGLPDWCYSWIKGLLALAMSSSYSMPPSEVAKLMASDGERSAYDRLDLSTEVDFPNTLPMGSGNYSMPTLYSSNTSHVMRTASGEPILDDEGRPIEVINYD